MSNLLQFLFPNICLGCETVSPSNQLICINCNFDLPYTYFSNFVLNMCSERFLNNKNIIGAYSLLYYDKGSIVQNLLYHLKYNNRPELGIAIADLLTERVIKDTISFPEFDYIIPIPLHPKKQKKRGYNQVDMFAYQLGKNWKTPILNNFLHRVKNTKTQTKMTKEERLNNLHNGFRVDDSVKDENTYFLLVDDVLTTGATIQNCADTLLQAYPNCKIGVLTIALAL